MPEYGLEWPNVEQLVVAWLKARTNLYVCTERPDDLAALADSRGVVQVSRAGGAGAALEKRVDVELEAFAADRAHLWDDVVSVLERAMFDLAGDGGDHGYVDDVENLFAFAGEPHPNPSVRYATGTFSITVRPL